MMDTSNERVLSLIKNAQASEKIARQRALLWTILPMVVGLLFLTFTAYSVIQSQRELEHIRVQLEIKRGELDKERIQAEALDTRVQGIEESVASMLNVVDSIEKVIRRKEPAQRDPEEARLLIQLRTQIDKISDDLGKLGQVVPNLPSLEREQIWITVLESRDTLISAKQAAQAVQHTYNANPIAIYKAPNGKFAVALKGDSTFTTAYKLAIQLKDAGFPDSYPAHSKTWGNDLLSP